MRRSTAPLSEVERRIRAELRFRPRARLAIITAGLIDALGTVAFSFGHAVPSSEVLARAQHR